MVRHDPHGYNGEPDPPGTPGVRALGAMAAAAQRAREVQEGGPPTRAVEIRFDDAARPGAGEGPAGRPTGHAAGAAHSRSPCGSPPPCSWWRQAPWPSRSERAVAEGVVADRAPRPRPRPTPPRPSSPHGQAGAKGGGGSKSSGKSGSSSSSYDHVHVHAPAQRERPAGHRGAEPSERERRPGHPGRRRQLLELVGSDHRHLRRPGGADQLPRPEHVQRHRAARSVGHAVGPGRDHDGRWDVEHRDVHLQLRPRDRRPVRAQPRNGYDESGHSDSGSRPIVSGRAQNNPAASAHGRNTTSAASAKRFPTSATAPKATRPTTAPRTPATVHHPITDARTEVGKQLGQQRAHRRGEDRTAEHRHQVTDHQRRTGTRVGAGGRYRDDHQRDGAGRPSSDVVGQPAPGQQPEQPRDDPTRPP